MLKGIVVAMLTPFDESGALSEMGVRAIASWLVEKGVNGLFVCGTAGEGLLMTREERQRVAEIVVSEVRGRIPVIVHTGSISTQETIALTRHAQAIGAQAAGVVAPPFYPLDNESLINHFVSVAKAVSSFPIYLYNLPNLAKNDIVPQVVAEVCNRAPNVVGIKDSSRDVERLMAYIEKTAASFDVIVGSDSILLAGLVAGAVAGFSALASVFPEPALGVYRAFVAGDLAKAKRQQQFLNKLRDAVKSGPYLAAYKEALQQRGLPAGYPRSPLRPLSSKELERVSPLLSPLLKQLEAGA